MSTEKVCTKCHEPKPFDAFYADANHSDGLTSHCRQCRNIARALRRKGPRVPRRPMAERFWSKVDRSGDCWQWTAHVYGSGYGHFQVSHRHPSKAHRVAWFLTFGKIPAGMSVLHRCDNRRCVNPAHLFLGTNSDNMADKVAKGRQARGSVCANAGSFRPGENVNPISKIH